MTIENIEDGQEASLARARCPGRAGLCERCSELEAPPAVCLDVTSLPAAATMVLQPLSEATKTAMEPLELKPTDRIRLSLDSSGNRFVAQLLCIKTKEFIDEEHPELGVQLEEREADWPGPSQAARDFFHRVPEARHMWKENVVDSHHKWRLGATDFTALLISHCWPADRILFASEEASLVYHILIANFFAGTKRAADVARFKNAGKLPPLPSDWEDHPDPALRLSPYQVMGVLYALDAQSGGLFCDRGTGKTPMCVRLINMLAKRKTDGMLRVMVVCPQQVRLNWQREIARFTTMKGKSVVARGGQLKRLKAMTEAIRSEEGCRYSVVIVGYDSLPNSLEYFTKLEWDLVIWDESHFFKSSSTQRFKTAISIRDLASKRRLLLTGTPIGNSPVDLWSQLEALDRGASGFVAFKAFHRFHTLNSNDGDGGLGVGRLLAIKNVPLLQERLARMVYSVTKEEAQLGLPDKVPILLEVEMTERQRKIYEDVADRLMHEIQDQLDRSAPGDRMVAEHILTKLLRLSQITSGFVTWDASIDPMTGETLRAKRIEQINAVNPKVQAILEELTDPDRDPQSKAVVWCNFREDIRAMSAGLDSRGIVHGCYYGSTSESDRDDYVSRFNGDPDFKVLVCNPQTAGEGLNLLGYDRDDQDGQGYCDQVFFFSCGWSYIQRAQAEDRAHRRGTRMPVRITDVVVPGTIDEVIRERVAQKKAMSDLITDVSEILKSVLDMDWRG